MRGVQGFTRERVHDDLGGKVWGDYFGVSGRSDVISRVFHGVVSVGEREKMTPLSCSSVTRMAHAARKNVVFAFCGEEEDEKGGDNKKNNNDGVLRSSISRVSQDIELSSNRGF